MANKKTIQEVDRDLDRWHRRLSMAVRKIDELRALRKKMVMGKVKVPPPPGVKVKIESNPDGLCADVFGDLVPSFGPRG